MKRPRLMELITVPPPPIHSQNLGCEHNCKALLNLKTAFAHRNFLKDAQLIKWLVGVGANWVDRGVNRSEIFMVYYIEYI